MKRTLFCLASLTLFSLLAPSCAYLQTHKNITEIGAVYDGLLLEQPTALYRQGHQWYLGAQKCQMKKAYPILHDNIMLTSQNAGPRFEQTNSTTNPTRVYIPISSTTAHVLQQRDGYFTQNVLLEEIRKNVSLAQSELPGMSTHAIRAEIQGEQRALTLESTRDPATPNIGLRALSWVDRIVIDWPGSVVYNVCIPFMAPFFFFSDFLADQ